MRKNTIVVDLDGTLANIDHRLHLVSGKRKDFDAFYAGVGKDSVNEWCATIMNLFWGMGWKVIIVSARRASATGMTRQWLEENNVKCSGLYLLRPDGDSTPDQELKRAWLREYGAEKVLFVVDDRTKVVNMWREEGVTCLQCARWEDRKLDPKVVEVVAEQCHQQWARWTEHLLSKTGPSLNTETRWTINAEWIERWRRQINTSYADLSEDEKESDRREARKILRALEETA